MSRLDDFLKEAAGIDSDGRPVSLNENPAKLSNKPSEAYGHPSISNVNSTFACDPYSLRPPENDVQYAEAIADTLVGYVRYDRTQETWLCFDSEAGWMRDSKDLVIRMFAEYAQQNVVDPIGLGPRGVQEWHSQHKKLLDLGNHRRITNAMALLQTDPRIAMRTEDVDADPSIIGCKNGILNLKTGRFTPFIPEKLVTRRLHVRYDPDAKAPNFIKFLERVQPDEGMRRFLQRFSGYALSGEIRDHVIAFHYGTGANGKGTFLEQVLLRMLGDYGAKLTDSLVYKTKHGNPPHLEIAGLAGCRFALGEENQSQGLLNEQLLKAISGGDRLKGRFHHANFFEYFPGYKIHLVGNHKPIIKGTDDGIWRRFLLIDWPVQIPPEERDPKLKDRLEAEFSGILNWFLEGYRAWNDSGLNPPERCKEASSAFRAESDDLRDFIEEALIESPSAEIGKGALFNRYQQWSNDSGIRSQMTKKALGAALIQRGWRDAISSKLRQRVWVGWRLNEYPA